MKISNGMKPMVKVVSVRSPTPDLNSTAAASSGATAHSSQVTRFGWVVPRRVSRRYASGAEDADGHPHVDELLVDHGGTVCCPGARPVVPGVTPLPPRRPLTSPPRGIARRWAGNLTPSRSTEDGNMRPGAATAHRPHQMRISRRG